MMTTVNASSDRHDVQRFEPTFQDIVLGLNNILFVTRHVYYSTEISWYRI